MSDLNVNPLYTDPGQQVSNPLNPGSGMVQLLDPLELKIEDSELLKISKARRSASNTFFEDKYNLSDRRKKNERYLFGRQVMDREKRGELKDYETRSADNALYEIEASLKPLAMSKLPDIIVTPGGDDPKKQESADNLSKAINDVNKSRNQREVLGIGFKHLPVYFTAIVKARWDASKGKYGEYCFEIVPPEYVIVDYTAQTKDPDDMGFIAQCVPMTVQDMIMMFPKKKAKIMQKVISSATIQGRPVNWKDLASEVKVWETHFDWYQKKGTDELMNFNQMLQTQEQEKEGDTFDDPQADWETVAGVMWEYEDILLDKTLDPNYDHEGEDVFYTYAVPGDETTKQEVDPQMMLMSAIGGQQIPNLTKEKIYHNYFQRPHKPYYFFGYDQWNKIAYDETSRIEQNIRNQENLDDQNKTILDQLKTRIKHIWSKDSGLRKEDVQRLDMDNPKMDAWIEGDPNRVHKAIEPERPDAAQFNALQDTRSRMYAISGATAVRGQIQSDTATTNQIAREADFTRADDLVEDTINACCEWMAGWQLQFVKLRYTQEHMRQILGTKGSVTYVKLRRDMVSDGMEVMIKASSTDKLKAQRNAMDAAQLGAPFTNPLDFFTDMGFTDPEGRTEKGIMFATDPQGYFAKYVLNLDTTNQMAAAVTPAQASPVPTPDLAGQPVPPAAPVQSPSMGDTTNIATKPALNPQASPRFAG